MRTYLADANDDRTVGLADFSDLPSHPRSSITFVDLTDADPEAASAAIGGSEAVFLVSTTHPDSIDEACIQAAWLQYVQSSFQREEGCGLLLVQTSDGIPLAEAERRVGIPLCGVFRSAAHTAQLARWIAQD
jgi:hypothetical protein